MLTVARLRKSPTHLYSFTGLTREQFDQLLAEVTPVYAARERERKNKPGRRRAPGAGHPFALALPERLLLTLMYLRLYVSEPLLGYLFDVHPSSINRERNLRMVPALTQVLPMPAREEWGLVRSAESQDAARGKRIDTLEELLRRHPEIAEVLIDATEQPLRRPKDPQARRERYSGKKKRHTAKTQVTSTRDKRVLHASRWVPGSLHDMTLLRFSGVLHALPASVRVARLDRGYEGAKDAYPTAAIEQPFKTHRTQRLTWLGHAYNRMQARLRIVVEHALAALKRYRVLAEVYRGQMKRYDDCFGVVCGLQNFRVMGRLSW